MSNLEKRLTRLEEEDGNQVFLVWRECGMSEADLKDRIEEARTARRLPARAQPLVVQWRCSNDAEDGSAPHVA